MNQQISYQNKNFFQLIASSFLLLLGRVEHVIYVSLPFGVVKYLIYSLGVYLVAQTVSTSGIIIFFVIFFCIFMLNSFLSILIMLFLSSDLKSFFKPMEKARKIFGRVLISDLLFLLISVIVLIPSFFISGLNKTLLSTPQNATLINSWIILISVLIWFILLYIPYHGTIRPFMILKSDSLVHTWLNGYKIAKNNFLWLTPYYVIFGLLYFFLNPGFTSYILFEILNVILLPFQASLDLSSFRKISTFREA
ncbi:MAG: hypothetical protein KAH01_06350 [Caldisericia bacterium]|nr:hypothetical protein [Caldisericia bacterium]